MQVVFLDTNVLLDFFLKREGVDHARLFYQWDMKNLVYYAFLHLLSLI